MAEEAVWACRKPPALTGEAKQAIRDRISLDNRSVRLLPCTAACGRAGERANVRARWSSLTTVSLVLCLRNSLKCLRARLPNLPRKIWSKYICMFSHTHTHTHTTLALTHARTHARTRARAHTHSHTCAHTDAYTHMCVCVRALSLSCTPAHVHTCKCSSSDTNEYESRPRWW